MNFRIVEYDELLEILDNIAAKDNNFKKQEFIKTKYDNISIPYYTYGNGDNHIIVVGGTHGSEIISVDLVVKLMEDLKNKDLKDYTFHFIPLLNPEGYIISTSMVRGLIKRNTSDEDIEKISYEYYIRYREDDMNSEKNPTDRSLKLHQVMFDDTSYLNIPDKYPNLKNSVKQICDNNPDIPRGSLVVWRGNGDGIETNRDNEYVEWISLIKEGKKKYGNKRYNNIPDLVPGPLGAISYDINNPNIHTIENTFLISLIDKLYKEEKYCGIYTYHATGATVYYKPSKLSINKTMDIEKYNKYLEINNLIADVYRKNTGFKDIPIYTKEEDPDFNGMDEYLRTIYPAVILVELSYMGGNPIGPYGDKANNYIPTIENNINSFYEAINENAKLKRKMYK